MTDLEKDLLLYFCLDEGYLFKFFVLKFRQIHLSTIIHLTILTSLILHQTPLISPDHKCKK